MSYNGSGTFNINTSGQPVVTGTVISSTAFNALTADLGTGLSTAITKDGQTVATARIPFAQGINSSLVTDATSTTTGSIITAGGVGIAKALFVGTTANIAGTTTLAGVTATSITDSGLTSGRVTFASTAGLLADAAALTWDGTSLTATKLAGAHNGTVGATTPSTGAFTTLSATGNISTSTGNITAAGNAFAQNFESTTNGVTYFSDLATRNYLQVNGSTAGSADRLIFVAGNTVVGLFTSTGLAVTGTLSASGNATFGAGAAGTQLVITLEGGSNSNSGSYINFKKAGTSSGYIGDSGILEANTSTDLGLFAPSGKSIRFYANAAEAMRLSSTGLAVTGTLSATGVVTFSNYGVGTATFNGSGVISSVSDETWKVKDGAPVDTDAMLNKLEPGYWYYNDEKKETFGKDRQLGFYAQNVNAAIGPEAAPEPESYLSQDEDGKEITITKPWGYYDRSVLAVTVMSLQKALATIESLTARITALEAK